MRRPIRPAALVAGLILVMLAAGSVVPPRPAAAQPALPAGVAVVQAAYGLLLDQFYRPLAPEAMLRAGWDALDAAARNGALPAPTPLPPLPPGRDEAFAAFDGWYRGYLATLPPGVTRLEVAFIVTDAMARTANESHTVFLPPDEYRGFVAQVGGDARPSGLGLLTTPRPPWIVRRVAPDGPAARAGIRPGDQIVAIDGATLIGANGAVFGEAAAGAGDRVLELRRADESLAVTVARGPYYFPPVESRLLRDGAGYLRIEGFVSPGATLPDGSEFLSEVDRALDALDAAGATGLVLDLRGNGGGLTYSAAALLGRFLPEDARTIVSFDERGHELTDMAAGPMRPRQLPMTVLVDRETASSAEIVAAALKEHGRALVVGERTAGVLAASLIQPLPEGAGLSVAVAGVRTAIGGATIDGAGVAVDLPAAPATHDDLRINRDPQIEAAVAALMLAPPPPAATTTPPALATGALRAAFAGYLPAANAIPTDARLRRVVALSTLELTRVNEWIAYGGSARDPLALHATQRGRGWLGSLVQEYGAALLVPPTISIAVDRYAGEAGAADALRTNDFPETQERIPAPVALGEETAAYRGAWLAQGGFGLSWRRGPLVFTVSYLDVPGGALPDTLIRVARLVDAAAQQAPFDPARYPAATPAPAASPSPSPSPLRVPVGLRFCLVSSGVPC